MKKHVLAAALGLVVSMSGNAATVFGRMDCGHWIKDAPVQKEHSKAWLLGYLSGMNATNDDYAKPPPNQLAKITSAEQIFLWMDNYCTKKPLNTVSQGAHELFGELINKSAR